MEFLDRVTPRQNCQAKDIPVGTWTYYPNETDIDDRSQGTMHW
ncbi:MAG: hypothetical protein AVDCRST_MAG87-2310 [uncultured Thermomicrobiales bacterium]|uniref:Uncharacterized protein n=1 Tax=uncultured Thermomicrobiales bacterium TaxID=1645740 RepID=A0A6J4V8D4_9BACT|nr:MAG: hypothetical protein AVDCRST_MAG87-2310 [uncultured Thermomicrobiales bacterium]